MYGTLAIASFLSFEFRYTAKAIQWFADGCYEDRSSQVIQTSGNAAKYIEFMASTIVRCDDPNQFSVRL
ncbi:hypothetical protein EOPP23_18035 [Endozoicomonas sp. OPT23]|nr:hypothetical protein [Endozoicomonas sp. OPT23]